MKLKLKTSKIWYNETSEIKALERLGFKFEKIGHNSFVIDESVIPEITFNCVQELEKFVDDYGRVIIDPNSATIEIYNDYRE